MCCLLGCCHPWDSPTAPEQHGAGCPLRCQHRRWDMDLALLRGADRGPGLGLGGASRQIRAGASTSVARGERWNHNKAPSHSASCAPAGAQCTQRHGFAVACQEPTSLRQKLHFSQVQPKLLPLARFLHQGYKDTVKTLWLWVFLGFSSVFNCTWSWKQCLSCGAPSCLQVCLWHSFRLLAPRKGPMSCARGIGCEKMT